MRKRNPARRAAEKLKNDTVARELVRSDTDATENTRLPVPSTNPATNLVIADIIIRAVSTMVRNKVERRVASASFDDDERARQFVDGRTIVTSMALYGASKLATRSPLGLGIVATALVGKTLYDRGKTVQKKRRAKLLPPKDV